MVGGGTPPSRRPSSSPVSPTRSPSSAAGELRASKVMQQRAFAHQKIEFVWNKWWRRAGRQHGDRGAALDNVARRSRSWKCRAVRGHRTPPNTALFKGQLEMEENGYLRTLMGPAPTSTACSPAVTSRTTVTARPSPRPGRDAWPRRRRTLARGAALVGRLRSFPRRRHGAGPVGHTPLPRLGGRPGMPDPTGGGLACPMGVGTSAGPAERAGGKAR